MAKDFALDEFPLITHDKLRYSDTDRQGHVNNAVFSSFLETGRVEVLYNDDDPVLSPGSSFVIASLKLDFLNEVKWPGHVDIGTGISKIGTSSLIFYQKLFQNGICVASGETVIVQVKNDKSGSSPLSLEAKEKLNKWYINNQV